MNVLPGVAIPAVLTSGRLHFTMMLGIGCGMIALKQAGLISIKIRFNITLLSS